MCLQTIYSSGWWCPLILTASSSAIGSEPVKFNPRQKIPANSMPLSGLSGDIPPDQRFKTGRALVHWGDAPLAKAIATGKQNGRFDDDIVVAAVRLIQTAWKPKPRPQWIAFVPSLRHPDLVPDVAERIGRQMRLPVIPCIEKVKQTAPQKIQEGSFNQCRNLDGAFQIRGIPPNGPALLLDDLVDSGWTFAIITLLLHRAGSGPVHPFALASTRKRDT